MKGLEWGILYNDYKDFNYDPVALEKRIKELIDDDELVEVTPKSVRMRKRYLDETERKRASKASGN